MSGEQQQQISSFFPPAQQPTNFSSDAAIPQFGVSHSPQLSAPQTSFTFGARPPPATSQSPLYRPSPGITFGAPQPSPFSFVDPSNPPLFGVTPTNQRPFSTPQKYQHRPKPQIAPSPSGFSFLLQLSNSQKEKEKFVNNFAAGFKELWESKTYSDFIITAGPLDDPIEFKVHKCVLGIQSSVLAAAFKNPMKESQEGKMHIEEFSAESVKEFLDFMYTGEVSSDTQAMDLFAIAAKYDVGHLKLITEKIVLRNISDSNAIEVFGLGHLYNSEELQQAAFEAIKKMFPELNLQSSLISTPVKLKKLVEARRGRDRKKQDAETEYQMKVNVLEL